MTDNLHRDPNDPSADDHSEVLIAYALMALSGAVVGFLLGWWVG